MCHIHLHFLFFISFAVGNCLVICNVVLDTLSVHFRGRILRRHLLMKVCILVSVFCVLRHILYTDVFCLMSYYDLCNVTL